MNLFQIKISVDKKQLNPLFSLFKEWDIGPEGILKKETDEEKFFFEIYLTKEQLAKLNEQNIPNEILQDLSKIPNPQTYVSKENPYKKKLEHLRKQKREKK